MRPSSGEVLPSGFARPKRFLTVELWRKARATESHRIVDKSLRLQFAELAESRQSER